MLNADIIFEMELFLDSANITEICEAAAWGILDGVTTNPTHAYLAAKAGATYISPFLHRKDLAGEDGIQLVRQIRHIYAGRL